MIIKTELLYKKLQHIKKDVERSDYDSAIRTYQETKKFNPFLQELFITIYERRLLPLKRHFIDVNNLHVERSLKKRPGRILVLLPFCLQSTLCKNRVIWNINNCKECGLCPVGHIKGLAEKFDFTLRMAERGVMARDILKAEKPDMTIAVACADELFEGILRCRENLVYGVSNTIQDQYCINTMVDAGAVSVALEHFSNL